MSKQSPCWINLTKNMNELFQPACPCIRNLVRFKSQVAYDLKKQIFDCHETRSSRGQGRDQRQRPVSMTSKMGIEHDGVRKTWQSFFFHFIQNVTCNGHSMGQVRRKSMSKQSPCWINLTKNMNELFQPACPCIRNLVRLKSQVSYNSKKHTFDCHETSFYIRVFRLQTVQLGSKIHF